MMNIDEMTLVELKQARGNMRGWMDAVMAENGARGVVELDGMERLPSLYDLAAVEFALRQVETEIAWRREERDEMKISDKANKLIENLRKFAVQDEIGGLINKVAGARVASFELEDYIAKLEAENRALRHALELRECEETEHKPDPLEGVPYVSFSNAEIAAMTPEHPLYKLVKGGLADDVFVLRDGKKQPFAEAKPDA